ncbi:MAG: hypothetical protein ABI435_03690, partial [Pseudolysinimonas sp.]
AARSARSEVIFAMTPGGRAAQRLASALDDAYYAHLRFRLQRPVFGLHGENYDGRRERVWDKVNSFCDRTITLARKEAIDQGWTASELHASGLDKPE